LHSFVVDLLALYDAIVIGLNTGKFEFSSPHFSRRPQSSLPRFLGGVLSKVFDEDGSLKEDYNVEAVELVLQSLAIFRRVKHPALKAAADEAAIEDFRDSQAPKEPHGTKYLGGLRRFWSVFTRDFEANATLGRPGPGAVLQENHPYLPGHTYLCTFNSEFNPALNEMTSVLSDDMVQFYDYAFASETGFPNSREFWLNPAAKVMPAFYLPVPNPRLRLVTVDKNVKTSRPITVTHAGNVCLGASYRNTIKRLWRNFGIESVLNVDDQSKSHRTLEKNFSEVSCFDIKGGSNCFTTSLNRDILPDVFQDFIEFTSGSTVELTNGEIINVNTQLMGDAISVGLLTTNLYFVILYALFLEEHHLKTVRSQFLSGRETYPIPTKEQVLELIEKSKSLPINVVGDDMIFPSFIEPFVRRILRDIGIIVNERKSSSGDSRHKESCGSWFVMNPKTGKPKRIYPFRAPEKGPKAYGLLSGNLYLRKIENSTFYTEMVLALSAVFGKEFFSESYTNDQIGSSVGSGFPKRVCTKPEKDCVQIDDTSRYMFNLRGSDEDPSLFSPRFKRGRPIPRYTLNRYSDKTKTSTRKFNKAYRILVRYVLFNESFPAKTVNQLCSRSRFNR
jgi:hypothetical protein